MATEASANIGNIQQYEIKKTQLIEQLKNLNSQSNDKISLHKKTSNLFRNRLPTNNKIDVRNFNRVLVIDPKNLTATVEGMTTYETLVTECLKYSCLPTVVPELKSITVGGALSGCAIESSSFAFGLVHETIQEFELLLGDGTTIICNPENEYRELFYAFPNSYGTLGYALKIKLQLVPAKKYVKIVHRSFKNPKEYFSELHRLCSENKHTHHVNYIEGVIFDTDKNYLTLGKFTDDVPFVNDYTYKKIYYRSIPKRQEDYLTANDYIWRWDTDWFWCSKFFFMQNPITRLLLGKWLLKSTAFWRMRNIANHNFILKNLVSLAQRNTEAVIQDVQIPIQHAEEFLTFFHEHIGIKPVWICPTMPYRNDKTFNFYPMDKETLYINFGFWDVVPTTQEDGYYNRLLEAKVKELKGFKGLYSNVYYSEDEFWNIYDKEKYFHLKKKYDPTNRFKNLYQKCSEG